MARVGVKMHMSKRMKWGVVATLALLVVAPVGATIYKAGMTLSRAATWGATGAPSGAEGFYNKNSVLTWHPNPDAGVESSTTLPNQAGQGGKFLGTDGAVTSWQTTGGGGGSIFLNTTSPLGGGTGFGNTFTLTCATCLTGTLTSTRVPVASGAQTVINSGYTLVGNVLTLASAGTGSLWTSVATGGNIGSTSFGDLSVTGARFFFTQRALTTGTQQSAVAIVGGAHTGLTSSTEQFDVNLALARTVQFNTGGLALQRAVVIQAPTYSAVGASVFTTADTLAITGPPIAGTNMTIINPFTLHLQTGNMGVAPAFQLKSATQGATNTVGMTLLTDVADGATTVDWRLDSTTACATNGCLAYQLRNGGSDWFTMGRTLAARKFTFFCDADSAGNGPVLVKSTASSAGVTLDATTAGGRIYQMYSTIAGLFVIADITAALNRWQVDANGHWSPFADNTYDIGIAATNRVRTVNTVAVISTVYANTEQSVAFSATPTFNCNTTGQIHFGDVTANVTSITMTDGTRGGQRCTIVIRKDGTGTSWTIPGNGNWTPHVRTMAAAQGIGTSANAFLVFDYVWDAQLGTPSWVMTHAPGNPL